MFTESAIRRMKNSAARITPTFTATTRSTNKVKKNVSSKIPQSTLGAPRTSLTTCGNSLMFQATTNRTADKQHKGMAEEIGASRRITRIENTEGTTRRGGGGARVGNM